MNNDLFYFHVNSTRNDFASWVRGVYNFNELANEIQNLRSKQDILNVLNKHKMRS